MSALSAGAGAGAPSPGAGGTPRAAVVLLAIAPVVVLGVVIAVVAGGGAEPRGLQEGVVAASASPSPRPSLTAAAGDTPTVTPSATAGAAPTSPAASPTSGAAPAEPGGPLVAPAVDLGDTAPLGDVATARIVSITAVDGEAQGPGQVAGPALRIVVGVTNGTAAALDLGGMVVAVSYGDDQTPASELSGPGVVRFPEQVAAGAEATGTVVVGVPLGSREVVTVDVDLAAGIPLARFVGSVG